MADLGNDDGDADCRVLFLEGIDALGDLAEDGLGLAPQRDRTATVPRNALHLPRPRRRSRWTPCGHHATNDEGRLAAAFSQSSNFFGEFGEGEGIRTLDPNLGKVGVKSAGISVLQFALHRDIFVIEEMPMVAKAERKEYPISMRLPEADIAMIDRAAGLRGRSRTDFVREAAVRAAEELLMESRLIRMSPEGFSDFMAVLSGPVQLAPEMVELAKRRAPWDPDYVVKS